MLSAMFCHITALQGGTPWGRFLDAGTGVNSSLWSTGLATDSWTGVTAAPGHATQVKAALGEQLRPQDRLLIGDWTDERLLAGEQFETVLADYLLGAVEGFSPYFQPHLFARLRPLMAGRLYVVGLDPYVVGPADTEAAKIARRIGRLRDACMLAADETPYREYPAEWAVFHLEASGFRVSSARRFANRYRETWVNSQIDMALRRLDRVGEPALADGLRAALEAARSEGLVHCRREGGLRTGFDWVIEAEPI